MDEDEERRVLGLFDLLWFHRQILHPVPPVPPPAVAPPELAPLLDRQGVQSHASEPSTEYSRPALFQRRHHRSLSDESLAFGDTVSPLVIGPPKLQTVFSGKTALEEQAGGFVSGTDSFAVEDARRLGRWRRWDRRRKRRKAVERKSLTDLEFEEVKGFADLGFTFSEAETDPRLMEIVPGLHRQLRRKDLGEVVGTPSEGENAAGEAFKGCNPNQRPAARPYLSEAWDAAEEAEEEMLLRDLRIRVAVGGSGGLDLKDQLKFWAHAVASTVR